MIELDDTNVLLFTRATDGKEFSFYIRNLYILTARAANMSMLQYLTLYANNRVPDPELVASDANLVKLYDMFDWSIHEILTVINPDLLEEKPTDKTLCARSAVIHIVQQLIADYKIKREP